MISATDRGRVSNAVVGAEIVPPFVHTPSIREPSAQV